MAASLSPAMMKEKKAKPRRGMLERGWFQDCWGVGFEERVGVGGEVVSTVACSLSLWAASVEGDDGSSAASSGFCLDGRRRRDHSRSELAGFIESNPVFPRARGSCEQRFSESKGSCGGDDGGGSVAALVAVVVEVAILPP